MSNQDKDQTNDPPSLHEMKAQANRRRLVVFMVLIFIILISFFVGRVSHRHPLMNEATDNYSDSTGRQGIPPDSLAH